MDMTELSIDWKEIWPLVTHYGVRVVGALVALFLAWVIAGWARRSMLRGFEKKSFDPALSKFFSSLARYTILAAAVLGILGLFGIQTASFAAVIAAAGLAIGLAFQGTLSNFASGVMLLVFRPFKVNDLIRVSGQFGVVKEIELFTTELATVDNRRIIVPNSSVFGSIIENITHYPTRRVDIDVGVTYSADIDQTRAVLERAAAQVPGVLSDPPSQVFLKQLGASSVDWQVRLWCKAAEYWDVHQAGIRAAKAELEKSGLSIPFPQLDVHLDSPQ